MRKRYDLEHWERGNPLKQRSDTVNSDFISEEHVINWFAVNHFRDQV